MSTPRCTVALTSPSSQPINRVPSGRMLPAVCGCVSRRKLAGLFIVRCMVDRVVLFIDAQNVYRSARDAFPPPPGEPQHVHGQVNPLAVGGLICERPPVGAESALSEVRVYTGRPDATRQPKAYAAHMRQCAAWESVGITVVPRALRYSKDWPTERPREKGIDVQLAIDFVSAAVDGRFDVGIIFSTDTDLRPALEFVSQRFPALPRAESAAWKAPGANRALMLRSPRPTWCHYLDRDDYLTVHDSTDYNR